MHQKYKKCSFIFIKVEAYEKIEKNKRFKMLNLNKSVYSIFSPSFNVIFWIS